MTVLVVGRIDDLSAPARSATTLEASESYYCSLPWYANFAATCLDPGERLALYEVVHGGDRPLVLFMRARSGRLGPLQVRTLASLTNYYSCAFALSGIGPARDGAGCAAASITAWASDLRRSRDRPDRVTFDALDAPSPSFDMLTTGLRDAGYLFETYPQFGNWFLRFADRDFDSYWADRDASLRNTVKRKERALRRDHRVAFETFRTSDEASRAVAAYEEVYAQSWKQPEPYRGFMPGLIRTGLEAGVAMVGTLRLDGRPVAAQFWIVHRARATIFKLAHLEALKHYSVGSILTRHLIRQTLLEGAIEEIDFGRGDDPYKRLWLPNRRQRWGIIAYEPSTAAGLAYAARNLGPKAARRLGRRLLGRPHAAAATPSGPDWKLGRVRPGIELLGRFGRISYETA